MVNPQSIDRLEHHVALKFPERRTIFKFLLDLLIGLLDFSHDGLNELRTLFGHPTLVLGESKRKLADRFFLLFRERQNRLDDLEDLLRVPIPAYGLLAGMEKHNLLN